MKYRAGMVILAGTVFGTSSLAAMPTDEPELPASIAAWGKTEGKPCVLDNGLHIQNTAYVVRGIRGNEPMQIMLDTELDSILISRFEGEYLETAGTIIIISGTVKIKNKKDDQWGDLYDLSLPADKKAARNRLLMLTGVDENEYHERCANGD